MGTSDKKIQAILNDLTNVKENLLSFSDDIWNQIDHADPEKLKAGVLVTEHFNELYKTFEESSQGLAALISQFTDVKEEVSKVVTNSKTKENERIIKELDKEEPHLITEDFTYKRPFALIIEGCAYKDLSTWKLLYVQVCKHLANKDTIIIDKMADNPEYISKQNRYYYTSDKSKVREGVLVTDTTYVEVNLSANHFAKRIQELLEVYKIDIKEISIYLTQDRNA